MTLESFLAALRQCAGLYVWQVTPQGLLSGHRDFVYQCPLMAVCRAHSIPVPEQLGISARDLGTVTLASRAGAGKNTRLRQALLAAVGLGEQPKETTHVH